MKIELKPVTELLNYENNSRSHSEEQIGQIANSMREFGFNDPIEIGPDNVIITRWEQFTGKKAERLE